jgi:hypothetical protein
MNFVSRKEAKAQRRKVANFEFLISCKYSDVAPVDIQIPDFCDQFTVY